MSNVINFNIYKEKRDDLLEESEPLEVIDKYESIRKEAYMNFDLISESICADAHRDDSDFVLGEIGLLLKKYSDSAISNKEVLANLITVTSLPKEIQCLYLIGAQLAPYAIKYIEEYCDDKFDDEAYR